VDIQMPLKIDEVPEELFRRSEADLDAAENLNTQSVLGEWEASFQRGQVVLFLAFHAVELCLKGCLKTLEPNSNPGHHTLPKLAQRLNSLVPGLNYQVPFVAEPVEPSHDVRGLMEAHDRIAHQQFRYPTDNDGKPWQGTSAYSPKLFEGTLGHIRERLNRARRHVAVQVDA